MWIHPDIVDDKQWDSSQPKLKGKSCNVIFLSQEDDNVTIAFLISSEEEKFTLEAQLATLQPVDTHSGDNTYDSTIRPQHDTTTNDVMNIAPVQASAPTLPLNKEKQKEIRFGKSLKILLWC